VETKADASPVTEADRRGEALILERLRADFPGVFIVAEEECADAGPPEVAAKRFFLVDPLDGTRAFISGSEHFTVNIALIENGAPVAGAVATPADGKVWFTAEHGARRRVAGGAERPVRVRPRPEQAEAWSAAPPGRRTPSAWPGRTASCAGCRWIHP
jgi:3'(2'), 5'-bisphosphate nucleotidase